MSLLGNCGCCGGDEPPPGEPPPGDHPDPNWHGGLYYAAKYAEVVIEGESSLLQQLVATPLMPAFTGTIPDGQAYDDGRRWLTFDGVWTNETDGESGIRHYLHFKPTDLNALSGGFAGGTRIDAIFAQTPGGTFSLFPFYGPNGTNAVEEESAGKVVFTGTYKSALFPAAEFKQYDFRIVLTLVDEVPESWLESIDDKLDAAQFEQGQYKLCYHLLPSDYHLDPYLDGSLSGHHEYMAEVPAEGSYASSPYFAPLLALVASYDVLFLARGNVADKRLANAGQAIRRRKQKTQVGWKRGSADPLTLTVHLFSFSIPAGFSLVEVQSQRVGAYGVNYLTGGGIVSSGNNQRIPANATYAGETVLELADGEFETIEADEGEVIMNGDGLDPEAVLTPISGLVFGTRILTVPGGKQVAVVIYHEEPYLTHEIYRTPLSTGVRSLIASIDAEPFTYGEKVVATGSGWGGYTLHPTVGIQTWAATNGYFWQIVDADVVEGDTYSYQVKSYYGRGSGFSDYAAVVL